MNLPGTDSSLCEILLHLWKLTLQRIKREICGFGTCIQRSSSVVSLPLQDAGVGKMDRHPLAYMALLFSEWRGSLALFLYALALSVPGGAFRKHMCTHRVGQLRPWVLSHPWKPRPCVVELKLHRSGQDTAFDRSLQFSTSASIKIHWVCGWRGASLLVQGLGVWQRGGHWIHSWPGKISQVVGRLRACLTATVLYSAAREGTTVRRPRTKTR